jgi:hypothetical protein
MEETEKIVDSLVEITLTDPQDFLKIKETLTRIGVSSRVGNKLYQSCHILHKRGKYYITHLSEEDIGRRNTIVGLLSEWGLCEIVDTDKCEEPLTSLRRIKILSHKNRDEWELIPKYHIGKKPAKDE